MRLAQPSRLRALGNAPSGRRRPGANRYVRPAAMITPVVIEICRNGNPVRTLPQPKPAA
jgi:hypothetical protein